MSLLSPKIEWSNNCKPTNLGAILLITNYKLRQLNVGSDVLFRPSVFGLPTFFYEL